MLTRQTGCRISRVGLSAIVPRKVIHASTLAELTDPLESVLTAGNLSYDIARSQLSSRAATLSCKHFSFPPSGKLLMRQSE
jgi:hypothetical protein